MKFADAHKELLAGKKIRRKEWESLMHLRLVDGIVKAFKGEYTSFYDKPEILVSNKWLVVDGDGKELSFIEALEELKAGKCITREDWITDSFIFVDKNQLAICKPVEFDFMPTWACLQNNDWSVLK